MPTQRRWNDCLHDVHEILSTLAIMLTLQAVQAIVAFLECSIQRFGGVRLVFPLLSGSSSSEIGDLKFAKSLILQKYTT